VRDALGVQFRHEPVKVSEGQVKQLPNLSTPEYRRLRFGQFLFLSEG